MRVIISAGGTGGHIYPAISIINKIKEKEPNSEILYIGTHDRMEKDIIPDLDINYVALEIKGFKRKINIQNIKNLNLIRKAIKSSKKIIKDFKPDVVIGVGGYVTGPVIYAANKLKIPTFIHEQNSVPGLTNKILSKYATKIGVSFEETIKYFNAKKTIYTGNPCGEDALSVKPINKEELNLNKDKKLVLIVMGSLGSNSINKKLTAILPKFNNKDYELVYICGQEYYETFDKKTLPPNIKLIPYFKNLTKLLKVTDLLISRAGASTISEIIALEIPTIFIPSPYVTNNHQLKNALELSTKKEAFLLEEKDFNEISLITLIDKIINDEYLIKEIKTNLNKKSKINSATIIYDVLVNIKGD